MDFDYLLIAAIVGVGILLTLNYMPEINLIKPAAIKPKKSRKSSIFDRPLAGSKSTPAAPITLKDTSYLPLIGAMMSGSCLCCAVICLVLIYILTHLNLGVIDVITHLPALISIITGAKA